MFPTPMAAVNRPESTNGTPTDVGATVAATLNFPLRLSVGGRTGQGMSHGRLDPSFPHADVGLARFERDFLSGDRDQNLPFHGMRRYLAAVGFSERIRGSHHIFTKDGVGEIINLQPRGSACKPYQVRQVRKILGHHNLRL